MNTIGSKISDLRKQANMSLQGLADQVDVSKAAIQQYENGTSMPGNQILKRIATVLGVDFWEFFRVPKFNISIESVKFRDGNKLNNATEEENEVKKHVLSIVKNYLELESILEAKIDFENPIEDFIVHSNADVEKAVKKVRRKWKIGNAPIDSLTELLEDKGIKIIALERDTKSGGLSGWVNNIPLIVINNSGAHKRETTRKRFTIAHELGHLLMKFDITNISEDLEEIFCNRFAAAFLFVDEVAFEKFGKNRTSISLGELKDLKETYGISIQSIIFRLSSLKLIDDTIKQEIIKSYDLLLDNGDEHFGNYTKSEEAPIRFRKLIRIALTEKRIEKNKASELSGIPIDELQNLAIKNFDLI
ncbi:Zn-dependent peptidase ImmA (M78 family) [Gillisia sp. Hel_I_86]|uniref:XRE family transcriptional regulator n=1 Tax=Gillisia sp. Hel_I_86 TaxID=1249981 RepID=UPI00119AF211|nr:XRE family transcriptional regulator [Gillisia sp. Hel_I_86]TVZ26720.1 Zn-dependent peptidase ImmA (M78 family) [Gillisia sp. Hel_I_86]